MAKVVHARLDDEADHLLAKVRKQSGLSNSEIVRRGLLLFAAQPLAGAPPRVIGVGRFASGQPDLGSNKAHLRGFGRK